MKVPQLGPICFHPFEHHAFPVDPKNDEHLHLAETRRHRRSEQRSRPANRNHPERSFLLTSILIKNQKILAHPSVTGSKTSYAPLERKQPQPMTVRIKQLNEKLRDNGIENL